MVDQPLPSFLDIAKELKGVKPLSLELTAFEAFTLVSHLQMSTRYVAGQGLDPGIGKNIAVSIQQALETKAPGCKPALDAGWSGIYDIDPNLCYWGKLRAESPLRAIFPHARVPLLYPFSMSSQAVGPHYLMDATRINAAESQQLLEHVCKLWKESTPDGIEQIKKQIAQGLPLLASHFAGDIESTPKDAI